MNKTIVTQVIIVRIEKANSSNDNMINMMIIKAMIIVIVAFGEDSEPIKVEPLLEALSGFSHLSLVHHETTAGVINPLEEIVRKVKKAFPAVTGAR